MLYSRRTQHGGSLDAAGTGLDVFVSPPHGQAQLSSHCRSVVLLSVDSRTVDALSCRNCDSLTVASVGGGSGECAKLDTPSQYDIQAL